MANVLGKLLDAAATIIQTVPTARDGIETIVAQWCGDNGVDPQAALKRLNDDLDSRVREIDSAIDARIDKLGK